jgi:hypothetical protein
VLRLSQMLLRGQERQHPMLRLCPFTRMCMHPVTKQYMRTAVVCTGTATHASATHPDGT